MSPQLSNGDSASKPRVLIVDDEPDLLELIQDTAGRTLDCRMIAVPNLVEARKVLERQAVELLITDVHLPDGDGTTLLPLLKRKHPGASAIVITGLPSVDGAITALRGGAVDFMLKPFAANDLTNRLGAALRRQALMAKSQRRLGKLREAVRRLNEARKVVTKKVDLLCNDLIAAYGELSRQLDVVRTQEAYKHTLTDVKDLEQFLCHTMDFLMRQMGYSNIAVFLSAHPVDDTEAVQFQLGAYMKYTIAGDDELTTAMRQGIVPLAAREGSIRLTADEAQDKLTPDELDFLGDQDLLAVNCTYLGEPLAVMVVFRDTQQGFSDADAACLNMVSPLFAVALASIVRGHQPDAGPSQGLFDDDPDDRDNHRRDPESDWWKNGEEPPF